jgi:hypothetical protein
MGIKSFFTSFAAKNLGIVKQIGGDTDPILLVVDGGSAGFNLSIGMAEKLLSMNISLLVVMDGCIDMEHAKGDEQRKRGAGRIEEYTDRLCREDAQQRQSSNVGMCKTGALQELQARKTGPGYLHIYEADGEADIDVALFGSVAARALTPEDVPNWGMGSDYQNAELELLRGRLVYGVLAEDSDYILTEGLTYLKLTSLEARPVASAASSPSASSPATSSLLDEHTFNFYCEHYEAARTAANLGLDLAVLPDAACLYGNDFTVPQQPVIERLQVQHAAIHYTPYTTNHTLHTIHYTPYTTHHTLHPIHYTPYTTHHTLHTIHYTPYTTHHTLPSHTVDVLDQGADVNAADNNRSTAFHCATCGGHLEVMKWLHSQGADIKAVDGNGHSALHYAARFYGDVATIKWLVLRGATVTLQSNAGIAPLQQARLIDHCYTVGLCTLINHCYTVCTLINHCYTVCTLINHCYTGMTPLQQARLSKHVQAADWLERCERVDSADWLQNEAENEAEEELTAVTKHKDETRQMQALIAGLKANDIAAMKRAVDAGASVTASVNSEQGWAAVHWAAGCGNVEVMQWLVEQVQHATIHYTTHHTLHTIHCPHTLWMCWIRGQT